MTGSQKEKLRLLLVTPEPGLARRIAGLLAGKGMEQETAPDLPRALALGPAGFDLALVDLDAGEGPEACRALLAAAPGLACVALNGRGGRDLPLEALRAGAQDCLAKEALSREVLSRVLSFALERSRAIAREVSCLAVFSVPHAPHSARATAGADGRKPLAETGGPAYEALVARYARLLELAWRGQGGSMDHSAGGEAAALALELGLVQASPRDVMDLHIGALAGLARAENAAPLDGMMEEGRLLALEIMGWLASHYRNRCLGMPEGPAAAAAKESDG